MVKYVEFKLIFIFGLENIINMAVITRIFSFRFASNPVSLTRQPASALLAAFVLVALAGPVFGGDVSKAVAKDNVPLQSSSIWNKPAWLTEVSLGIKECYDDNVYLSGVSHGDLPATYTVPGGSVAALENHSSWITTLSGKINLDFAPLIGNGKVLQSLSLGYAPDFVIYQNAPAENDNLQRFTAAIKGKTGDFSFNLDEAFTYINGSRYGPTYPGVLMSAYSTAAVRERRNQCQERANILLQYDHDKWFARPVATLLFYDMNTFQFLTKGYQNYINRYDVNGGADIGYKVFPKFALTVGYRYGHQEQAEFSFAPACVTLLGDQTLAAHSPNDYQRILFGFEGTPWKWLSVKFQGGPDFRNFASSAPLNDKNPISYFGEGSLTASVTRNDSITFKYKQWEWVSSTGLTPYFDSNFDLAYTRKISKALSLTLGARAMGSDYNPNNVSATDAKILGQRMDRNDWEYTFSVGAQYVFNSSLSVNLGYAYNLGISAQEGLTGSALTQYNPRSFDDQVVSLGATVKF